VMGCQKGEKQCIR